LLRGIIDGGFEGEERHYGIGRTEVKEKVEKAASVGALGWTVGLQCWKAFNNAFIQRLGLSKVAVRVRRAKSARLSIPEFRRDASAREQDRLGIEQPLQKHGTRYTITIARTPLPSLETTA